MYRKNQLAFTSDGGKHIFQSLRFRWQSQYNNHLDISTLFQLPHFLHIHPLFTIIPFHLAHSHHNPVRPHPFSISYQPTLPMFSIVLCHHTLHPPPPSFISWNYLLNPNHERTSPSPTSPTPRGTPLCRPLWPPRCLSRPRRPPPLSHAHPALTRSRRNPTTASGSPCMATARLCPPSSSAPMGNGWRARPRTTLSSSGARMTASLKRHLRCERSAYPI